MSQVIDCPCWLNTVHSRHCLATRRCECVGTQYNHIQPPWRDVINPFCSKCSDAMQRGKVDMLRGYQLVIRCVSKVKNIVDEERIGEGLLRQDDKLSAARRQIARHCCADPRSGSLQSSC